MDKQVPNTVQKVIDTLKKGEVLTPELVDEALKTNDEEWRNSKTLRVIGGTNLGMSSEIDSEITEVVKEVIEQEYGVYIERRK